MNLQVTIVQINIEGNNMTDWIDDIVTKEKQRQSNKLEKEKMTLYKDRMIKALFPAFWKALQKQINKDCLELKEKLPDSTKHHIQIEDSTDEKFTLTCEEAPPFHQISVQHNINGQRIEISGGHTTEHIDIDIVNDKTLIFTWEGRTYKTEQQISQALIKYCLGCKE